MGGGHSRLGTIHQITPGAGVTGPTQYTVRMRGGVSAGMSREQAERTRNEMIRTGQARSRAVNTPMNRLRAGIIPHGPAMTLGKGTEAQSASLAQGNADINKMYERVRKRATRARKAGDVKGANISATLARRIRQAHNKAINEHQRNEPGRKNKRKNKKKK